MRASTIACRVAWVSVLLTATSALADPPETINLRRTTTVEVVARTKSAVVNISATRRVAQRMFADPWGMIDNGVRLVPTNSLGSGFIIHEDGYVITNHHVIDRARQIRVELDDGRKLSATLISSDQEADLAVLKIDSPGPFPTLELGDSAGLMMGEPVIAVGNPLGFSHSVSTGIVSAAHRELPTPDGGVLKDLIQTDAAINPGNSGGPLLNAYGQVVGINTAIRGDAQNIGFAIQVSTLRDLLPELLQPSKVTRTLIPLTLSERRSEQPPATVLATVMVRRDGDDTSAVLLEVNGVKVRHIVDACVALLNVKPGSDLRLKMRRDGTEPIEIVVRAEAVPLPDAVVQAQRRLGLRVEQVTPALAERYGLAIEEGVLVTGVARGSVAEQAGIRAGDVLIQLGRYRVGTIDDLGVLLQNIPAKSRVRVGLVRGNQVGAVVLSM
jgi:serine protease Do